VFAKRFPVVVTALLLAALAVSTPRPAAAADGYTVTDLGALPGKPYSGEWQQTINNAGVVAAYANSNVDDLFFDNYVGDSPYIWKDGTITPLPELPGATDTIPFHINNNGTVVGRSTQPGAPNHPVLWDHGVIQVLPELPGDNKGGAVSINDRGEAVGYSANTMTGIRSAVVWYKGTVSQLNPLPGGGGWDEAIAINENGHKVGYSGPGPGQGMEHIALWHKDGSVFDLGTLGGAWGEAIQINNKGQVVGFSATASNPNGEPFLWENGVLTDLGNFGGDIFGQALDINNKGQIVGLSAGDPSDITTYHALLWEHGVLTNLQTKIPADSGWQLLAAAGINEHGQIVGEGLHNGILRACLLTPKRRSE